MPTTFSVLNLTAVSWAGARPVTCLAAGFLLGSIPFSYLIGRRAGGVDVRMTGTRNPGATNVWKSVGRLYGILAGAADAAKGAAAVWLCWLAGLPDEIAVWGGTAAVLGHDFSPWLGFRGGKGGATTLGVLACFVFPELVVVLVLWLLACALAPRLRFLTSLLALSSLPVLTLAAGRLPVAGIGSLPPRPGSITLAALLLVILLWSRILPGLRKRTS